MIVLALVAQGATILCETHDPAHERFLSAAETILTRIRTDSSSASSSGASKMSYAFEEWLFHYIAQDGMVYMTVADTETGRRMPFTMLAQMQKKFLDQFDLPSSAAADPHGHASFKPTLSSLVAQFNDAGAGGDAIAQAKTELAGVKDIMTKNVEQILSRGERIELLMDRTDNAASQSMAFRRRAVGLRRQMWWKNTKVLALAGFSSLVLLLILYGVFH